MKILHVITSLMTGGAEHLVVQLVNYLRLQGHESDVCVFNGEQTDFMRELKNSGCRIWRLGHSYYNPIYILRLSRIIRNYDIVHTHNSSPQLFGALAAIGWRGCLITTEHNTDNRKRHMLFVRGLDRWMYGRYSHIICISEQTKRRLQCYLGDNWLCRYGRGRLITIANGVDVARFGNAQSYIERDGKNIVVMVAAFRPQKDHVTLLRAIAMLPVDFRLWLVGDGETRGQIEQQIDNLGLQGRVRMFGNRIDVPEILKSADIIVMSSNWEGFGLAAVEGMAAGKPVIASDVDGLRQIVEGYGLVFRRGDDAQLADYIKQLVANPDVYQEIAQRCKLRAEEYDIRNMMNGYMEVYNSIVK